MSRLFLAIANNNLNMKKQLKNFKFNSMVYLPQIKNYKNNKQT